MSNEIGVREGSNSANTKAGEMQQVGTPEVEAGGGAPSMTNRERSLRVRLIPYLDSYGIIILVAVMVIVLQILRPEVFLSWTNVTNIFRQIAVNAILALGMFIVILSAGIDLSVGATMALSMVVLAVTTKAGFPWYVVIWTPLLVGVGIGLLNGLGLTKLRLPHPFIMTLGMLNIVRGLTNLVSGGVPVSGLPDEIRLWGARDIQLGQIGDLALNVPVSMIVTIVLYVGVWIFLRYRPRGRHIYALGGNPQAARVVGIHIDGTLIFVYTLCGAMAGVAGLLLAGRTNSGFPNAGIGAELDAIAAVIIGGASFFGGRGTVLGVFAGALIMGMLRNGLNLLNVSVFWQQILIGVVIIAAVYVDVLRRKAGSGS
jgi:ribose/xylose/arabinose/galactoside ABC-type transport system permease subunit